MSTRLSNVILAASLAAFACAGARAQTATPTPTPQQPAAVEDVDLGITARVTARELRFEKVPNTKVEFPGKPRRETVWQTERENLPDEVRPGVTYRDIGIRLRITSVFADIDRIVAEALGEKPLTDPPTDGVPQPPNDQPPSQPPAAADAPRASLDPPATAPATNRTTRQRRGNTRARRHR